MTPVTPLGLAALAFAAGCGTYSLVRPADTLQKGQFEVAAGLSASGLGEVNTVVHAAAGITDRIEILAQNEIWNTIGEVRFGFLNSHRGDPVGLAVGVGGGEAVTLVSAISDGDSEYNGAAGTASLEVGRDFGPVEVTLGNREVLFFGGYLASSTRLALRIHLVKRFGFLLEGGATVHTKLDLGAALVIGEGTGGLFVQF